MRGLNFLIGVVHRDPFGHEKLSVVFQEIEPEAITLEISRHGVEFRKKHGKALRLELLENIGQLAAELDTSVDRLTSNGRIAEILAQLELPFEYTAALEYAESREVLLVLVDLSIYSREKTKYFHDLISITNLRNLLAVEDVPLEEKIVAEYRRAGRMLDDPKSSIDSIGWWSSGLRDEWNKREAHMARVILRTRKYMDERRGGSLIHVGGWQHLLSDGLGSRLHGMGARSLLLD
jgi:hypothetical protein